MMTLLIRRLMLVTVMNDAKRPRMVHSKDVDADRDFNGNGAADLGGLHNGITSVSIIVVVLKVRVNEEE